MNAPTGPRRARLVAAIRARPHGPGILDAIARGGGDPDARRPDGDPALMPFIDAHDATGLRLMQALGANLDALDRAGDPLITAVAMAQDWDLVWALIELGAAWDYEDGRYRSPLSVALRLPYPAADSPQHAFKRRVWTFLHERGVALTPIVP